MPIIKDTNGADTAVTIRRFPNGSDIAGLTGVQSLNYINLNRAHFGYGPNQSLWAHTTGGTVVIRCELADDATGDFYGDFSTLHISISNKTITWWSGTYAIGTKTWQKGVHMYGFTPDQSDSTKFLAWYDNERFGTARSITETGNYVYIGFCCGHSTDTSGVGSDGEWAIRVWDVTAYFGSVWHHIYPIVENPTTTAVAKMMETRIRGDNNTIVFYTATTPVSSSSYSAGPTEAWGVSIHDLKNAFNVGYNDAMAIVCADNGSPSSDADPADKINDGTTNHNMAFRMADGTGTAKSDPSVQLPSGYSVVTRTGQYRKPDYSYGDLIYGRKPKWPIWADGLRVCKFVEGGTYDGSFHTLQFRFNFMKNHLGKIYTGVLSNGTYSDIGDYNPNNEYVTELLRRFDGISTKASNSHAPAFSIANALVYEYHNRVNSKCSITQAIIGCAYNGQSFVQPANKCAFAYSVQQNTFAGIRVGNLAPWDLTYNEIMGSEYQPASHCVTFKVYGVEATIDYNRNGALIKLADIIQYGVGTNGVKLFCKGNTNDRATFRDSMIMTDKVILADRSSFNALFKFFSEASWANLSAKASLGLITIESGTPTDNDIIHTDKVMPNTDITIKGSNNPDAETSGTTGYNTDRFVLGENGGVCTVNGQSYHIGVLAKDTSYSTPQNSDRTQAMSYEHRLVYNNGGTEVEHGYGIGCSIALYDSSNTLLKLVRHGSGDDPSETATIIVAYVEVTVVHPTTGNYVRVLHGFTVPESLRTPQTPTAGTIWYQPYYTRSGTAFYPTQLFGLGDSYVPSGTSREYINRVWPIGTSIRPTIGADGNYFRTRSCIFRWKDLDTIGGTDYQAWTRPSVSVSGTATPCPVTVHMRIFENDANAYRVAPFAWDLFQNTDHNACYWDENSGSAYVNAGSDPITGSTYRFYFENTDRIMPVAYEANNRPSSNQTILDGWFTIWKTDGSEMYYDKKPSIRITLGETPLHNAYTDPTTKKLALFTISSSNSYSDQAVSGSGGEGYEANAIDFKCYINGPITYPNYALLADGRVTVGNQDGFYHIRIVATNSRANSGSMYRIRLLNPA